MAAASLSVVVVGVLVVPDRWGDAIFAAATHRVGGPTWTWPAAPLPIGDPPQVRLAVAGDVGTGGDVEWRTAATMATLDLERDFDALVLLGDNVYPSGDPERVDTTVSEPFADVLDGRTALLPVLGNHDVRDGNGPDQAAALGMPGRWYATRLGDVLVVSLDSTQPNNRSQLDWLGRTLATTTAPWIVASLHHPPWSAGWHGSSGVVREAFGPLFEEYGVQLVLAGHDHDYQRSHPIDGVIYVVSGAAAKTRRTGRADFTAASWSTHHFVDLRAWPDRLELRAINQDGMVFDHATLTNPRAESGRPSGSPPLLVGSGVVAGRSPLGGS